MGLEKLSSNVWSHYLKIYVWLEGRALYRLRNEFSAVFKMSDGNLYKDGKKKWTYQMVTEIKDWYETNKEELQEAWKNLHSSCF